MRTSRGSTTRRTLSSCARRSSAAAGGWTATRTSCRDRCTPRSSLPGPRSRLPVPSRAARRRSPSPSCVRPGHHATADRGSGFCLLNNVALAVAGLRETGAAARIAIVDWDVHHGDGTQRIFDADPDVWYGSTHQAPFYPGTGGPAERGRGAAEGTKQNRPLEAGEGDPAFVEAWRDDLLPAIGGLPARCRARLGRLRRPPRRPAGRAHRDGGGIRRGGARAGR